MGSHSNWVRQFPVQFSISGQFFVGFSVQFLVRFPAVGRTMPAVDEMLVDAWIWICAGMFGLMAIAAAGVIVHAGPSGLLEQAKFTVPLNEPTEMMEIGGEEAGGKTAVAPAATVSINESGDDETQKSPVAVPVRATVCVGTEPLSSIVSVALRAAGSLAHTGVKVTLIEQLVVIGPPHVSLSAKSGPLVLRPVIISGWPVPTLVTAIVCGALCFPTG